MDIKKIERAALGSGALAILTTEKDLARLGGSRPSMPWLALRIDVEITAGADILLGTLIKAAGEGVPR